MAFPECIIPPWVQPVTGAEPQLIDDQTVVFAPRFARGNSQRQSWGDPLWGWKVRYQGLSQSARAALRRVVLEARGKAANIRMTPGLPLRGSFPATELLANNDFSNGTTGWSTGAASYSFAVTDSVARITRLAASEADLIPDSYVAVTQYAPYVSRGFVSSVKNAAGRVTGLYINDSAGIAKSDVASSFMYRVTLVSSTASIITYLYDTGTAPIAGDYFDSPWMSLSRCALIDNGPNALLQSDVFGTTWTLSGMASVSSNSDVAPDGTTTGDAIIEDGASSAHLISQAVTVSSAAADYAFSVCVKAYNRSWCVLEMSEGTGSTYANQYFNLTTGAASASVATGANWANNRSFSTALGNGWFRLTIVARKTNASTSITCRVYAATSDGISSYVGGSFPALVLWRATFAQSSVPTRGAQTTTTAATGTSQSGGGLYLKGLPASMSGLLLAGDFFEINGELKQCTASLDSDAAGLGYVQFRPCLAVSPADNDPVIILNPMGRFMFAADPRITENYGLYTDVELDLLESYS